MSAWKWGLLATGSMLLGACASLPPASKPVGWTLTSAPAAGVVNTFPFGPTDLHMARVEGDELIDMGRVSMQKQPRPLEPDQAYSAQSLTVGRRIFALSADAIAEARLVEGRIAEVRRLVLGALD